MTPRPYTPATRAADQARYDAELALVKWPEYPEHERDEMRRRFGREPTEQDIKSWQWRRAKLPAPVVDAGDTCDACGQEVERLVMVGQEYDYNSSFAVLCRACLVEAIATLDGAP